MSKHHHHHPTVPYTIDDPYRGCIQGLTFLSSAPTPSSSTPTPLCHYFGGIPYALPPIGPYRWKKPRPLPPCYRYGTKANPGVFTGSASMAPQPTFSSDDKADFVDGEEDCLQLNVWVPAGEPPSQHRQQQGWPVLVFFHGGFLQFGSPNAINPAALLSETAVRCVVVVPAYRVNVLGFLAGREIAPQDGHVACNFGFWDQRLALEWAWKNCSLFGGDAANVSIAGFSAGAHSTFHQLAYDLFLPREKAVVKRAIMWSNGPGLRPKSLGEAQAQFDELLDVLGISKVLSPAEKMERLRGLSPRTLYDATRKMKYHQYRAVSDDVFVRKSLFRDIDDGTFSRRMQERNVRLLIGECSDEHWVYGTWYPPQNSLSSLATRLEADYPVPAVRALLEAYYPDGKLPADCESWRQAFGRIYADLQIHILQRGFIERLAAHGGADLIYRYKIEWLTETAKKAVPEAWGVTHGTDQTFWWWGNGVALQDGEKEIVRKAFGGPLGRFLKGEKDIGWEATGIRELRRLKADGEVDIVVDEDLEKGSKIWRLLMEAGDEEEQIKAKL